MQRVKKATVGDSSLPEQGDRVKPAADHALDSQVSPRRGGGAYRRRRFPSKYTKRDVELLAEVDGAHGWLSGPATVLILKREFEQFGKAEYARSAGISVAHLYNLRRSARYRKVAAEWKPTQPSAIAIGERRKPDPQGQPGFLRIDTVHQGDWEWATGKSAAMRPPHLHFSGSSCVGNGSGFQDHSWIRQCPDFGHKPWQGVRYGKFGQREGARGEKCGSAHSHLRFS